MENGEISRRNFVGTVAGAVGLRPNIASLIAGVDAGKVTNPFLVAFVGKQRLFGRDKPSEKDGFKAEIERIVGGLKLMARAGNTLASTKFKSAFEEAENKSRQAIQFANEKYDDGWILDDNISGLMALVQGSYVNESYKRCPTISKALLKQIREKEEREETVLRQIIAPLYHDFPQLREAIETIAGRTAGTEYTDEQLDERLRQIRELMDAVHMLADPKAMRFYSEFPLDWALNDYIEDKSVLSNENPVNALSKALQEVDPTHQLEAFGLDTRQIARQKIACEQRYKTWRDKNPPRKEMISPEDINMLGWQSAFATDLEPRDEGKKR